MMAQNVCIVIVLDEKGKPIQSIGTADIRRMLLRLG
jgi:hypothetical protein